MTDDNLYSDAGQHDRVMRSMMSINLHGWIMIDAHDYALRRTEKLAELSIFFPKNVNDLDILLDDLRPLMERDTRSSLAVLVDHVDAMLEIAANGGTLDDLRDYVRTQLDKQS